MKKVILKVSLGVVGSLVAAVAVASTVLGVGLALHYQELYDDEASERMAQDAYSGYKTL